MFEATGESRYIDVLETSLYNAALAGISLDGRRFFYTNTLRQLDEMPVELRWSRRRQEWISCFCCPPNLTRLIAETNQLAYARSDHALWVNLFGGSRVQVEIAPGKTVVLEQSTNYPWDGTVTLKVVESISEPWTLAIRVPGWAKGATATIGSGAAESLQAGTYWKQRQTWAPGDTVKLELPLRVRLLESHPLVEETRGHVAVQRGRSSTAWNRPIFPHRLNCTTSR